MANPRWRPFANRNVISSSCDITFSVPKGIVKLFMCSTYLGSNVRSCWLWLWWSANICFSKLTVFLTLNFETVLDGHFSQFLHRGSFNSANFFSSWHLIDPVFQYILKIIGVLYFRSLLKRKWFLTKKMAERTQGIWFMISSGFR